MFIFQSIFLNLMAKLKNLIQHSPIYIITSRCQAFTLQNNRAQKVSAFAEGYEAFFLSLGTQQ